MKVSWLLLTYNRAEKVQRAVTHNMRTAGRKWDELIWVDNGSSDGVRSVMSALKPDVSVLHDRNLGVAPGYNRAMVLATGTHLVITGCDMLMPEGWLDTFCRYFEAIPETGVASIYSGPLSDLPERARKGKGRGDWQREERNGLPFIHAMPIGRRMFRRELLRDAGYLREDFGLYGWEDCEWGRRVERVCDEQGLLYYVIPDQIAEHLGTEGIHGYDGKDEREYHAFKQRESNDPAKQAVLRRCETENYPYWSPYV